MLFAGFNVSRGEYSLLAATLVGTFANLVGSWIAYAVGYYGRIDILEKHGRKLHIKPSHLAWADRWFERHGDATVFFTRMLPIVRTFISLPAGVARMPFWRFSRPHRPRLPAVGLHADVHRPAGRRALGGLEGQPALHRLRGRRRDRRRRRLPRREAAAGRGARSSPWPDAVRTAPRRAAGRRCTGRRSSCRCRRPRTSRSCPGCSAGSASSTPRGARSSRCCCTPGRASRWAGCCGARRWRAAARSTRAGSCCTSLALGIPSAVGLALERGDRGAPRARPRRRPPGSPRARVLLLAADALPEGPRTAVGRRSASTALVLGARAGRGAGARACRGAARRWRPRGCGATRAARRERAVVGGRAARARRRRRR